MAKILKALKNDECVLVVLDRKILITERKRLEIHKYRSEFYTWSLKEYLLKI